MCSLYATACTAQSGAVSGPAGVQHAQSRDCYRQADADCNWSGTRQIYSLYEYTIQLTVLVMLSFHDDSTIQAAVCINSLSLRDPEQATTESQTWGERFFRNECRRCRRNCIVLAALTVAQEHRWLFEAVFLYCSKTRGLGAGRKLRNYRRKQLWADKDYKKSHLGNEWKKPFAGASHAKGIVLEKM